MELKLGRPTIPVPERIRRGSRPQANGCVLYVSSLDRNGYGRLRIDGKDEQAHIIVYELANGPIPEEGVLRHTCDVRNCIELTHLILGTQLDNIHDMMAKKRQNIVRAKLSSEQAREIYASAESAKELAKRYNVHDTVIWKIRSGKLHAFDTKGDRNGL